MVKKECELCPRAAAMFCDSDQASLCWDCDEKVHAANFLVAKHSRTLLCHVCQSPTAWKAAGLKLTPTLSVCRACADQNDDGFEEGDDDSIEEGDDDSIEEDEEEEEDGENQVVPLSPAVSSTSQEDASCSSSKRHRDTLRFESEEDEEEIGICSTAKRMRIGFPK